MAKTFKYYLKYWPLILVIVGLLLGQAYLDLMLPDYMSKIISEGIVEQNTSLIWRYGLIMLGYSLGVTACSISVGFIAATIGAKVARNLREDIFKKVSAFSGAEMDKFSVSTLITRSTNDITQVQQFSILFLRMVLYAPIMAIWGTIKAIEKSHGVNQLVWAIVVAVVALILMIGVLMLLVQPRFIKLQKLNDKINLLAREGLNGMLVIRAFNTQEHEKARFEDGNKELTDTNLFVNRVLAWMFPIINTIMYGLIVAVVLIISKLDADVKQIADMMAFIQYAMQIMMAFMMLIMVFIIAPRAIVSSRRIGEVLSTDVSINDKDGAKEFGKTSGVVEFKNVDFAYPGSEENVLSNINFTANPGEFTAIIGSTGSGKSTIVKLLPRMYDVTGGSITIDNHDIRDFTLNNLRDNIAYVPQKNTLFSGTIESNIKFSNKKASQELMAESARVAQATEFISGMPEQYESHISQGGDNVSGGQKQRLAIARALLKESPVFVFDDSFSALDFKTDAALRKELKTSLKDSALIVVAQRVGTIMSADKIVVLDKGKMVGIGKHKELLKTCDVYRDIAESQLSKEELA